MDWTSSRILSAKEIIGKYSRAEYKKALDELSKTWGVRVSADSIQKGFVRALGKSPTEYCKRDKVIGKAIKNNAASEKTEAFSLSDMAVKLKKHLIAKKEATFDSCLNYLETYPKKLEELLAELRAHGLFFELGRESIVTPDAWVSRPDDVATSKIAPTKGGWYLALAISDTHYLNRHSQEGLIQDVFGWATEEMGVRKIYHSGDWVDGSYDHGKNERSSNSIVDQYEYLCERLPRKEGVEYEGILGNHDLTFWRDSGLPVSEFVTNLFAKRGRRDVILHEAIRQSLRADGPTKDRGPIIQLAHPAIPGGKSPAKKSAYAITYQLQKEVEGFTDLKPDIFLMGHLHKFGFAYIRGVQAVLLPCALGPGSLYSQTFVGAPALGAVLIGWQLSELGMIRRFFMMPSWYHSREKVHEQRNRLPSIPLDEMFAR